MSATTAQGDVLPRPGWRDRAACRVTRPDDWYVRNGHTKASAEQHRTCLVDCPVVADCAADALDHNDTGVIRAGVALGGRNSGARRKLCADLDALGATRAES